MVGTSSGKMFETESNYKEKKKSQTHLQGPIGAEEVDGLAKKKA